MFDGRADPVRQLLYGIEIGQRKGVGISRKDGKHTNHSVLKRYRHNDDGSHSELSANLLVNPSVGLGVTAPLRHLPADGQSGETGLTIDGVSDLGDGRASYGAASRPAVA